MKKFKNYIYRINWSSPVGDNVKIDYCIGSTDGPWSNIVLTTDAHNQNPDGFYNWKVDISACSALYVRIWDIETDALVSYMEPVDIIDTLPNLHIQHYGDSISKLGVYDYIFNYVALHYENAFYEVDTINDQGIVGMWMGWYNNALEKGELFLNNPLPDILLLNSGMHDRTSFENEFDLKFREFLTDYRQRNPKAVLVWANTTHVSEELEDYQLYNNNIDRHSVEALAALNDLWISGRFIIVDQRKCQIDNNIPFIDYVHPQPAFYELYANEWIKGLINAIQIFIGATSMSIPSGTQCYLPITVDHTLVKISQEHFPYQIDLSSTLENNVIFKSFINSSQNITVYDPVTDSVKARIVDLDLTNNKLLISFDSPTDTDADKIFYICVGTSLSYSDDSSSFSASGYTNVFKINEFENGSTVVDSVGVNNGTVVAPATIGNTGKFGNCINGTDGTGHVTLGNVISMNSVAKISIECMFKLSDVNITSFLMIRYISVSNKFNLQFTAGQLKFFQSNGGSAYGYFSISGISVNEWHHLVCVFNGEGVDNVGRMQIYLDGTLQTLTFSGTIPATTYDLSATQTYIGYTSTSCQYVDEFNFLNIAVSLEFVQTRYNQFFDNTFFSIGTCVSFSTINISSDKRARIDNISQFIDAGMDVIFKDESGNDININNVILNTSGFINVYGKGYTKNDSKMIKMSAGNHRIGGMHCFLSSGTDKGIGIHVNL